ncbi:hypothetical protein TNIN_171561 [Trichonephila inaurata madagascariensis]|uniref:Uncharacterized protein n=1 Tax=Trichonephila inaurata madagascariensis TaxID=2747483 RepID=A0A8X6WY15_9ARAC|nr:hypothetical protein TNIN_171561 [Trichonephila inaurata madagascariensis]
MNTHLQNDVSVKTIEQEMHAANIYGRVAVPKPLVWAWNAMKRLQGDPDPFCNRYVGGKVTGLGLFPLSVWAQFPRASFGLCPITVVSSLDCVPLQLCPVLIYSISDH